MNKEHAQGVMQAEQARAELYDTLGQLRDRLDFAQRFDNRLALTKIKLAEQQRKNPIAFAAGVGVVAATTGLAVWSVTKKVARFFE